MKKCDEEISCDNKSCLNLPLFLHAILKNKFWVSPVNLFEEKEQQHTNFKIGGGGGGDFFVHHHYNDNYDLLNAIETNDMESVQILLQQGANVNMGDFRRGTPLMVACQMGNFPLTKLLVETYGASIHHDLRKSNSNHFDFDGVFDCDDDNCCDDDSDDHDSLDFHNSSNISPLLHAVSNDDLESVELLLSYGADVNQCSSICGDTPLTMACSRNSIKIVNLLLKYGADANLGDKWGNTPLRIVASTGCELDKSDHCIRNRILKLLIEKGNANFNKVDDDEIGRTPLFHACEVGNKCIINSLLSYGANTEVIDTHGRTPLFSACAYEDIVDLLISRGGANVHHIDDNGETALEFAQMEGYYESAKRLRIASLRSKN